MLECQTAMAGAALARLRLLYRMVRVGELLALVALVSWSSWYVPSAVAAAVRLAGSLLLNARFVFVLGNAIVLLLLALSRHDHLSSSSSITDQQPPAASVTATAPPQQQASSSSPSTFAAPTPTPTTTSSPDAAAAATGTSPPRAGAAAALDPPDSAAVTKNMMVLFEDKQQRQEQEVVVARVSRAPRRSRSEKMGCARARRAVSPELRRCESENGRRRRSSVTARDVEACSWGREDADEFRRQVEAFIARQTRFHREESLTMAAGAGRHRLALVE